MEERQEVRAISWTFPVCPPRANGKYNYRIYVTSSGYSPSYACTVPKRTMNSRSYRTSGKRERE
jgi:hypothetical protein